MNHKKQNDDDFEFPTDTKKLKRDTEVWNDDGSNKAFDTYDAKKDTRKYPVYRNDIKFKKYREVNPDRAIWNNGVKNDYENIDTDSIDYRIIECKRENYETLDLSHMNNNCFVELFSHKSFAQIKNKLQHLFAEGCDLRILPDISPLEKLQTLDLSNNKLKQLPELPETLEELIVNDNELSRIDNDLPRLQRFNGVNNVLTHINYSNSLERLHLKNNPIENIPHLSNLYFLDVSETKIKKLYPLPKLRHLEMTNTEIQNIPAMDSLEHLVCNDSKLESIDGLKSLQSLEMINAPINKIHYMKDLYTLIYYGSHVFEISKNYKILHLKKNKKNISELTFKLPPTIDPKYLSEQEKKFQFPRSEKY
jgi:Leucine-rich repeat (LRR) protein